MKLIDVELPDIGDFKERSRAAALVFDDLSRTKQSFKEECDINTIVRKFGVTGLVPVPSKLPTYGDFTGVIDYQTALNAVKAADDVFEALPSALRKRFDNDPQKFVEFCENPDNLKELQDLGLATKPDKPDSVATDEVKD